MIVSFFSEGNPEVPSLEAWLAKELPSGSKVGFDPSLTSELVFKKFSEVWKLSCVFVFVLFYCHVTYMQAVECAGVDLVSVPSNLVDVVWGGERPPRPCNQVMVLPIEYSGNSQPLQLHRLLLLDALVFAVRVWVCAWGEGFQCEGVREWPVWGCAELIFTAWHRIFSDKKCRMSGQYLVNRTTFT